MSKWICTITIKQHMTTNEDAESIQRAANAIAAELDTAAQQADDAIAMLACMGLPRLAKRLRRAGETGDVAAVNGVLTALYDYSDANFIWLG